MSIEMIEKEAFHSGTRIKVIGVGGGGSNAVDHMIERNVQGVEFVCANTDAQALARVLASETIQLGQNGLGAGGKPDKGREAAETAHDEIRQMLRGTNMLFITAGMGGGTGTGAAPVVARIAKDMGILTVAVVTKPFEFEGSRRMGNAEAGLTELEGSVDSLIVVLNEKLLEVLGDDISQAEAFAQANDVLRNAVGGIAEVINDYGYINVDFEDVRSVMSEPGKAMMGTALASGPDRARLAAEQAIACPLLEGVDLSGAKGVLVLITASKDTLKLSESREASNTVRAYAAPDANIIFGAAYDDALGENIRVTVVATGLSRPNVRRQPLNVVQGGLQPGLRTGTDNVPVLGDPIGVGVNVPRSQAGFNPMGKPTGPRVWGNNRSTAGAKVDALASSGMDDLEIPAFLRKQAD